MIQDRFYIGGQWVVPGCADRVTIIEAATECVMGEVALAGLEEVDAAVNAARVAFDTTDWSRTPVQERGALLLRLADGLYEKADEFTTLVCREVGSPISFSRLVTVPSPLAMLAYYAELAGTFPFEARRTGLRGDVIVRHEPVGVVAAIIPWNAPLALAVAKLAPAIAAGCTLVLKPAPEAAMDGQLLAEAIEAAGFPPGVVNVIPAGRTVAEQLVRHRGIDSVSFTGSTSAGKHVAGLCADQMTRVSLELGGKSAAVILDDADIEGRVAEIVGNAFMNNGQACLAQTRLLVDRSRYEEAVEVISEYVSLLRVGDPLDEATNVGPLVSEVQRDRVERYIKLGLEEGAKLCVGGGRPAGQVKGWFVEPTVFANVDNSATVAQEEIFGPVLTITPFEDDDHGVELANTSRFGLAGAIWTGDPLRGLDLARRIRTGICCVNTFGNDYAAPFGGFKESGMGREYGPEGLVGFCELKTLRDRDNFAAGGLPPSAINALTNKQTSNRP
jgi:betaine-aldehyde dehydrogenase